MTRLSTGARALALACWLAGASCAQAGSYDEYFRAAQLNDARTVAGLLAKGFDPNTIEEARGENGLIRALREDAMDVFRVLLNAPGIDLEQKAYNGDTALMIASFKGNIPAVKALLEKGAEPNRPGWTALHYAASEGHDEIVRILLDKSAYIDAESPNKTTPLMMAARGGHILTVKLLLDEGADLMLKNDLGMTALDFAQKSNSKDIAEGLAYRMQQAAKH
ncbi:ankyrin repeat domain-containing protein [Oxalobacteraceae bacterium OM1]|nr:ankyrin repeat domain-containing protein [Oxalobacteraceae bacterium OM1]